MANVTIYLGSRDVMIFNETNRVVLVSEKICLHPAYQNAIRGKDIALIHLPTEIIFNGTIVIFDIFYFTNFIPNSLFINSVMFYFFMQ